MKNPRDYLKSRELVDLSKVSKSSVHHDRRFQRFNLQCEVRLKFRVDQEFKEIAATTRNVSVGGFLLSGPAEVPLYADVNFFMTIRSSSLVRPVHLTGTGQIVRVCLETSGRSYLIAMECTTPMIQMEHYLPAIAFC